MVFLPFGQLLINKNYYQDKCNLQQQKFLAGVKHSNVDNRATRTHSTKFDKAPARHRLQTGGQAADQTLKNAA